MCILSEKPCGYLSPPIRAINSLAYNSKPYYYSIKSSFKPDYKEKP